MDFHVKLERPKSFSVNIEKPKDFRVSLGKEILNKIDQEQVDLAQNDVSQVDFVKNKSTKHLKNEGADGLSPYANEKQLEEVRESIASEIQELKDEVESKAVTDAEKEAWNAKAEQSDLDATNVRVGNLEKDKADKTTLNNYVTNEALDNKNYATEDYVQEEGGKIDVIEVNDVPQEINDKKVKIKVPTKYTDLTNNNYTVEDSSYVHTDNNYTSEEKIKLAGLENYVDTEVKGSINELSSKVDSNLSESKNYADEKVGALRAELYGVSDDKVINTITEIANALEENEDVVDSLTASIANKVDKDGNKVLSTNDYTTTEKNKLANIESGANRTVVIDNLSNISVAPVQSKVLAAAFDATNTSVSNLSSRVTNLESNKVDKSTKINGKNLTEDITLTKSDVDLSNVDNTSDLKKPISTATQAELDKINNSLSSIGTRVSNIETKDTEQDTNITSLSNNKVDKVEGKELSTNDFTNDLKTKLDNIEANAQVNKVENVLLDGTTQTINNKKVDLSISPFYKATSVSSQPDSYIWDITIPGFTLKVGSKIEVTFGQYQTPWSSLRVNNGEIIDIYHFTNGELQPITNYNNADESNIAHGWWEGGDAVQFIYNGQYWIEIYNVTKGQQVGEFSKDVIKQTDITREEGNTSPGDYSEVLLSAAYNNGNATGTQTAGVVKSNNLKYYEPEQVLIVKKVASNWYGDAKEVDKLLTTENGVVSVNGKTKDVNLTASDVGALSNSTMLNGNLLSTNPTLTAADVGALADTTTLADLAQDESNRTVSDAEKDIWNGKAELSDIKTSLSELNQDSGYRTVSDSEKASWNAKQNALPSETTSGKVLMSTSTAGEYVWGSPDIPVTTTDVQVDGNSITVNDAANLKTTNGDYDATSNPLVTSNDVKNVKYIAVCETAGNVSAKTVSIPNFSFKKGAMISIYFVNANTMSSATLNINGTGAKTIYRGDHISSLRTEDIPAGWNTFYYNGSYWYTGEYIPAKVSEANDAENAVQLGGSWSPTYLTYGETIKDNSICAKSTDGLYYSVKAGLSIDITGEIVINGSYVTANAVHTHNYIYFNGYETSAFNQSNISFEYNKPIYLVGTLQGNILTLLSENWYTQTEPTIEDGYVYLLVGYYYTTFVLSINHPMFSYSNGKFRPLADSVLNKAKSYTDSKIAELVGVAPEAKNTIYELAQALEENEDVVQTLNDAVSKKANQTSLDSTNTNLANLTTRVSNVESKNTQQDTSISNLSNDKADRTELANYAKKQEGVFFIDGTGNTTTGTWTGTNDRITSYYDGLTVNFKIGVAGGTSTTGTTLNINGLGAKPCYMRGTTKITTHYAVGTMVLLTYNATTDAFYSSDYDANSNVTQTVRTTNGDFPLLLRGTSAGTTTTTTSTSFGTKVTANPSTGNLKAITFTENGTTLASKYLGISAKAASATTADTATKATQDGSGNVITTTYAKKTEIPTVDSALSTTSTNAVQNKVITTKINDIWKTIYPVGALYLSVNSTSPASLFGGTWTQIAQGRALFGAGSLNSITYTADETVDAGLPNITGSIDRMINYGDWSGHGPSPAGAFASASTWGQGGLGNGNGYSAANNLNFDASRSSSIYGNSTTVQPNAYIVYMWKRTA